MSRIHPKPLKTQRGATLVELLVALVIAGLVFAGVYQIYINSVRTTSTQDQVAELQQTARVVMDQLMRELRLAGYDPASPGGVAGILNLVANPLDLSTGQQLILQGDFVSDNATVPDQVTYQIDNTTDPAHPSLTRTLNDQDPPANFGANIERLRVTFYDSNNLLTSTPSSVRRVTLELTARTDRPDKDFTDTNYPVGDSRRTDGYRRRTLASDVVLRNTGKATDTTRPNCPTSVTAVTTGDCRVIRVTWTRPADTAGDLAGYYVYYATSAISTGTSAFVNITDKGAGDPNYRIDITAPTDGNWNVAVTSYDSSGNLCDNNTSTPAPDPVTAAGSPIAISSATNKTPAAPGNATATPADNQATVHWGQVLTNTDGTEANDLVGYRLYRSTNSDMSGAVLIADEFKLSISQIFGGGTNHITEYVDNNANTFLASPPTTGPVNCQIYYYQVSVVDSCNLEGARTSLPGVRPPDNGKAPGAPTITRAAAGDDDLTIVLNWAPASVNPSPVSGYKIYYGTTPGGPYTGTSTVAGMNSPITISDPAILSYSIHGLDKTRTYYVKIAAFDDVAVCADETLSSESVVTSNACSPRLFSPGGFYVFPGQTTFAPPLSPPMVHANNDPVGLKSSDGNRYVTWAADPVDCDPDSSNFARNGFDITPQPPNTNPKVTFKIAKDVNGVRTDFTADVVYGSGPLGGVVSAPRNILSGYYVFPIYTSTVDLDTTKFCNVEHDFKAIADDGEGNVQTETIALTVNNGGIEVDSSVTVTSDITMVDDTHHIVRFGIKNTNAILDLKLNKITLTWQNNNAYLEKLEVLKADKTTVLGKWEVGGTPVGLAGIGAELTLNPVPTIEKADPSDSDDEAYIRLFFKNSGGAVSGNIDMRKLGGASEETITITRLEQQDAAATGTSGICPVTTAGFVNVHMNPTISIPDTVQNQPNPNTTPSQTPGTWIVPTGDVTVTTQVTPQTGFPLPSNGVKIYYYVDGNVLTAAPTRPSAAGGGGSYSISATGSYNLSTGKWDIAMPSNPDRQIWFYLEAMDGTATDAFNRNFDILPDSGVYTYVQCGTGTPSVSITRPSGSTATGNQIVNASVSTTVPISSVQLTVTDDTSRPHVPAFIGTKDMCLGLDGDCNGTPGGSTQSWTTTYNSDSSGGTTNVAHDLQVTAINACGGQGSETKPINK